jgi:hypothetical protein
MFQRIIVLVSSGSDHLGWLGPEDEGATVVQNIGKYLPSYAGSVTSQVTLIFVAYDTTMWAVLQ